MGVGGVCVGVVGVVGSSLVEPVQCLLPGFTKGGDSERLRLPLHMSVGSGLLQEEQWQLR